MWWHYKHPSAYSGCRTETTNFSINKQTSDPKPSPTCRSPEARSTNGYPQMADGGMAQWLERQSLAGGLSLPGLRLIYGWHVTTLWLKFPLWVKQQTWAAYGCLVAGQSPVAARLAYGLQAVHPLCMLPLVALYICYNFTFYLFNTSRELQNAIKTAF